MKLSKGDKIALYLLSNDYSINIHGKKDKLPKRYSYPNLQDRGLVLYDDSDTGANGGGYFLTIKGHWLLFRYNQ